MARTIRHILSDAPTAERRRPSEKTACEDETCLGKQPWRQSPVFAEYRLNTAKEAHFDELPLPAALYGCPQEQQGTPRPQARELIGIGLRRSHA
jgi:hypothetical protein